MLTVRYHPTLKPPHRTLSEMLGTPLEWGTYLHLAPPFSSDDVWKLQEELGVLAAKGPAGAWRPKLVFEPTPPSCHVGQRGWLEKVCPGLHVLSPNHEELLSFYGYTKMSLHDPALVTSIEAVMLHLLHEVGIGSDGDGIIVVRSGKLGCCVGTKHGSLRWFPPFYQGQDENHVKDVTGGESSESTVTRSERLFQRATRSLGATLLV